MKRKTAVVGIVLILGFVAALLLVKPPQSKLQITFLQFTNNPQALSALAVFQFRNGTSERMVAKGCWFSKKGEAISNPGKWGAGMRQISVPAGATETFQEFVPTEDGEWRLVMYYWPLRYTQPGFKRPFWYRCIKSMAGWPLPERFRIWLLRRASESQIASPVFWVPASTNESSIMTNNVSNYVPGHE